MLIVISLVVGILIGFILGGMVFRKETAGNLRVDTSDPSDGPFMFLELTQSGIQSLKTDRQITLDVKLENYISQK